MIKLVGVFFLFMLLVAIVWFFVRDNKKLALNISEAVKAGKVSTIVIPHDFKGIVNVK